MNICVFGDSIVYGEGDNEKCGWPDRMRLNMEKNGFEGLIYTLGIPGDKTDWLLERFEFELEQRIDENEEAMVIFAIGVNDSVYLVKEKRNQVDLNEFEKNINKLVAKARKYTKKIFFVGLAPVEKKKTSPIPWATNMICNNIYIERYNSKLKEICQREKIGFIDLYGDLIKINYKKLLDDGMHPNSEGHKWIAEKIIREILN